MKITGFETAHLNIGLKQPFVTSLRRVEAIDDIMIMIRTDTPLVGYGEACAVTAITGTTNESLLNELNEIIFPALMHHSIHVETIFTTLHKCKASTEAKACIDIALYDLLAKEKKQPLFHYLGAKGNTLITDLTISVDDINTMVNHTYSALEQGFEHLKIKLDADINKNIARMNAINAIIPKHIKLRLDPNQAFELSGALHFLETIDTTQIECLEQPFTPSKDTDMRYLCKQGIVPILADESLFSRQDAKRLLETQSAHMLNIKLMKSGGIHEAIQIAKLAKDYTTNCMIGSMLEGPLSLLAAVHFALSQENITMADLDSPFYLEDHPLIQAFHIKRNQISLEKEIGLGVDEILKDLNLFASE